MVTIISVRFAPFISSRLLRSPQDHWQRVVMALTLSYLLSLVAAGKYVKRPNALRTQGGDLPK